MLLSGPLGFDADAPGEPYINGGLFAQEMYNLKSQGYSITVKINSPGGMVTDGFWVIDAINATNADTHIVGLAASMAGICALCGQNRFADDIATTMVHPPQGGDKTYLEIIKANLSNLLDKRTKMSKEKIAEMMDGKSRTWFDASQMLEMGMVDRVIPTNQKFIKPASNDAKEIFAVYNSLNKNDDDMDFKELVKGIFPGKSDSEVITNTLQLKAENESLVANIQTHEAEIKTLRKAIEDASRSSKAVEVKNLVDGAVKAGKVAETARGSWEVMATADFDSAKTALESIIKVKNYSAAAIVKDASIKSETGTYAYLTKNDPKKLAEIMSNDPAEFDRLLTEFENSPKEIKK